MLLGGTAVAFSIVNLLPVDLLIEGDSARAVVMVLSLLLAGVIWNLATWWYGLPVSSSHTLIGSILGVGLVNSLLTRGDLRGVNWSKAGEVALSLLISPAIGFAAAAALLLLMKRMIPEPRLYQPPESGDTPPRWVRGVLLATCGGVSLAHGSNDGQKGMGLILLVLIGFLPTHYALNVNDPSRANAVRESAIAVRNIFEQQEPASFSPAIRSDLDTIEDGPGREVQLWRGAAGRALGGQAGGVSPAPRRPPCRASRRPFDMALAAHAASFAAAIEYVPYWVVLSVAVTLGAGTAIGYKRIVVTVAEKIGKAHMTYAQGAAAELIAAITIGLADSLAHAGEHHPRPLLRRGRHDVGKPLRYSRSDGAQDRPRLGPDPSRGDPALRRALQPRRASHSGPPACAVGSSSGHPIFAPLRSPDHPVVSSGASTHHGFAAFTTRRTGRRFSHSPVPSRLTHL